VGRRQRRSCDGEGGGRAIDEASLLGAARAQEHAHDIIAEQTPDPRTDILDAAMGAVTSLRSSAERADRERRNRSDPRPLPLDYPDSGPVPLVTEVQTQVYDRSTVSNIACALEEVDDSGVVLVSVQQSTQGGGPGAPAVGMTFLPPAGAAASGYWRLRCSLPAAQSGAFSYLGGPVVHTSE
jgi:hypothetical protein